VLDAHADFILRAHAEAPDTTLDEMVERLQEERGVTVVRTVEVSRAAVTAARKNWVDG
jgi:hypothetical protein